MQKAKKASGWPLEIRAGSVLVKIYQTTNRGRKLYQIVYRNATGERVRLSFSDLEKTKREARKLATQLQNGDYHALELHGQERLAYERAVAIARPVAIPVDVVVSEYAEAKKLLAGHGSVIEAVRFFLQHGGIELTPKLVPDIVAEYLAQKEADGCGERHLEDLRNRLSRFAAAFPTMIGDVSTPQIQSWLNSLKVGARTRNNFRNHIVGLFGFAKTQCYLPKTSVTAAEDVSKAKDHGGEIQIFTVPDLTKLLEEAEDSRILAYLALGAFTGLRTAELKRLDWNEIKLEHGHLEVKAPKAKTAQRRLIPIQTNLKKWLTPIAEESGSVFKRKTINHIVADYARKQGVSWLPNGLRHSYASYRLADYQDTPKVALEMGNSPEMIFRNYREVVTPAEAKKWWKIAPK